MENNGIVLDNDIYLKWAKRRHPTSVDRHLPEMGVMQKLILLEYISYGIVNTVLIMKNQKGLKLKIESPANIEGFGQGRETARVMWVSWHQIICCHNLSTSGVNILANQYA